MGSFSRPVTGTAVSVRVRGSSGGSVTAVITPSLRSRPAAVKVRLSNTRSSVSCIPQSLSNTRVVCVCVCSVIYDSCPQASKRVSGGRGLSSVYRRPSRVRKDPWVPKKHFTPTIIITLTTLILSDYDLF